LVGTLAERGGTTQMLIIILSLVVLVSRLSVP
jgi:hypothetical protein